MANDWDIPVTTTNFDESQWEVPPAGNWPAVICAILEVGTHEAHDEDGKAYDARRIVIGYELPTRKKNGSPFYAAQEFTYSMHTSSNLYKLVERLSGPRKEGDRFNPRPLLGLPVMLEIVHAQGSNRRGDPVTYANVKGVGSFPQGMATPALTRAPLLWGTFEKTPIPDVGFLPRIYGRKVEDVIRSSREYQSGAIPGGAPAPAPPATNFGPAPAVQPPSGPSPAAGAYQAPPAPAPGSLAVTGAGSGRSYADVPF